VGTYLSAHAVLAIFATRYYGAQQKDKFGTPFMNEAVL
jgi:hypothetical protein